MTDELSVKVVLVGASGSGKTSIASQFMDDEFTLENNTTIGVEFRTKLLETSDGTKMKLQLWDTAGQDKFRTVVSSYYNASSAVILVYDISSRDSFENLNKWLTEIQGYADEGIPVYLVANKIDVEARVVSSQEGIDFANRNLLKYYEVSAKTAANIHKLFCELMNDPNVIRKAQFHVDQLKSANQPLIIASRTSSKRMIDPAVVIAAPSSPETRQYYHDNHGYLDKNIFTPFQIFQIAYFEDHHKHWFAAKDGMYSLLSSGTYTTIEQVSQYVQLNEDSRSARVFYRKFRSEPEFKNLSPFTKFKIAYYSEVHELWFTNAIMYSLLKDNNINSIDIVTRYVTENATSRSANIYYRIFAAAFSTNQEQARQEVHLDEFARFKIAYCQEQNNKHSHISSKFGLYKELNNGNVKNMDEVNAYANKQSDDSLSNIVLAEIRHS